MSRFETRRRFIRNIGASAAALSIPAFISSCQKQSKKPNILFIAIDDLNDWVGCLGGHPDTQTPNIDDLAVRGTLFENTHVQAPICGPSRASLMSGLLPSTTGIYGQIKDEGLRKNEVMSDAVFLSQFFSRRGYKTMGVGKLFHGTDGNAFQEYGGIHERFGPKPEERMHYDPKWFGKPPGTQTDWGPFPDSDEKMPDWKYAQWAMQKLEEKHEQPFFLACGFVRPHVPWHVPAKWFERFDRNSITTPPYLADDMNDVPGIAKRLHAVPMMPTTEWAQETGQWKDIVHAYLASTTFVDDKVGMLLQALYNSHYADNTLIILWADHGYHIGEKNRFAKHSLWERATRVPLIIAGPGLPENQRCKQPAGLIDMYPTLVDLCGYDVPASLQGHSLKPLIENPDGDWPHAVLTTYGRNNHSIRSRHYRYTRYEDGSEELYDHRSDPNEWHNLAGDEKYNPVKERLRIHLPTVNADWHPESNLSVNDYFVREQGAGK